MSSVSKSVEINLDAEERELLEKAILKCKDISNNCIDEGLYLDTDMVFECLVNDYDSNRGQLSAHVDIEE